MPQFQFQYRYDSQDQRLIRDSIGLFQVTPSANMTVWAVSLAVSLLMLGAVGFWSLLGSVFLFAVLFFCIYTARLGKQSLGQSDCQWHSTIISETGIQESTGESLVERAWGAFEEFQDLPNHFLLKHYDQPTLIPKRAIGSTERTSCRDFISAHLSRQCQQTVPIFDRWFGAEGPYPIYRFRWRDQDFEQLKGCKMRVFEPRLSSFREQSMVSGTAGFRNWLVILAILLLSLLVIALSKLPDSNRHWSSILVMAAALGLPLLVALFWWRHTKNLITDRRPRVPDVEISVTLSETGLLIGYPLAVARYGFDDIRKFYYGEHFVGFQPGTGLVHVIANHAFGGRQEAWGFLQLADELRSQTQSTVNQSGRSPVPIVETGNPYQSPAGRN